ncbi:MAG: efflux RND transporter periplasmic adaptor subunit [Pirellulaceae bacterium]|nr:efflux RND transporter periplasmic adaptor subunit [Pirellulaceae bacterium]
MPASDALGTMDSNATQSVLDSSTQAWRSPSAIELLRSDYPNRLADQIDELLGCSVWLSYRNQRGHIVETIASRNAQAMLLATTSIESIAGDASQTHAPISSGCPDSLPTSPSAIMDQVWAAHPGTSALSASFVMAKGNGHWVLTLAWRASSPEPDRAVINAAWIELNGAILGRAMEAWTIHRNGCRYQKWCDRLAKIRSRPSPWLMIGFAVFAGLMIIPVPYRPKRDCTLEPSSRQYVASPIEGRLKSIEVRPGDEVSVGQLLGKIDDTQILRELAMAEAEIQTQNKKRDVALAARAGGDLRLAQLECQLVQLKIDALNDQLQRLEVISPSDGIIVQGDWYGNEGMPVSFGQTLFEISPLDRMTAEVHLKAEDLPWVHVGTSAILRTDSRLNQSWRGAVERLTPRAEIIEDEAVFIGEMEVTNSDNAFRPGMKAKVVVDAGKKTIGWLLFRKPYQWLQNQWVW